MEHFTSLEHLQRHIKQCHQPENFYDLPKHCQFLTFDSRLQSYDSHLIPPILLALCGFYYTGYRDCVQCFWCGLKLYQWLPTDDPWEEHRKYYPSCYFYKKCTPIGIDEVDLRGTWV